MASQLIQWPVWPNETVPSVTEPDDQFMLREKCKVSKYVFGLPQVIYSMIYHWFLDF